LYRLDKVKRVWGVNIIGELVVTPCGSLGIKVRLPGMFKFTLVPGIAEDKMYVDNILEPDTSDFNYLVAADGAVFFFDFLSAVANAFKFDVEELYYAMWLGQSFNNLKLHPKFADDINNQYGIEIRTPEA